MGGERKRSAKPKRSAVAKELRRQTKRFAPVLEISPTAIVVTDIENRVASWNPAAERLFGYSAKEAAGRDLNDLVASTETLHVEAEGFRRRVAASEHVQSITRRTRKDGSVVDVQLSAAPLVVDGEAVGTFAIYHDITELNRQRRFLESFLEMSPEAIVTYEHDVVTSWNPAAERLFGYSAEEAIGRNADELVVKGRPDLYISLDAPTAHFVTQRTRKDGSLVDVDVVGGPITVGGEIVSTQAFYHDVTELQEQKRYFESLLEVSPEAIITTDLDDVVTSWNPAAERLFGYTAEEAVGRDLDDLVATRPELQEEAKYLSASSMEAGSIHRVTQRTRKDGSLVDVDIVGGPVILGGKPVAKHAIYHDITDLQEQKRYFESLLDVSPTAIVVTDLESRIVSWNPAAEKLFGYSAEEAVGRRTDDLVAARPELHEEAVRFTEALMRGERVDAITQRTRADGSLVDVQLLIAPVSVGGVGERLYVMYHDISELQEQKRYFESLFEISPAAVVVTDLDARVVSWNPVAERLFGYSSDEAVGNHLDDLVAARPDLHQEALAFSEAAMRGERTQGSVTRTRKDGSLVDVQMVSAPVVVGEERVGFVVIYHDVTEIERQRRYYESLVEANPVAIVLMTPEGIVNSWNPAAERLFGYTAEEAIGSGIDDLIATSDEVREEALAATERGVSGTLVHLITRRTHKDGSLVDVEVFGAPVIVADEAVGLYGLFHDIRPLQQARRDAEAATEAKSAFLATMSHEIRTPLNAVIGMTGLLLDTELSAEQRNYAEVTRNSGDALLGVINDILDFSKIEAGRLDLENAPFDLRECVESALELAAAAALKKGLDIAYDLDTDVPGALVGDVTRLRQILINLLNNAVKFTERGEVVVIVGAERVGSRERHRIHFAVRDTGIGIPDDRKDRLFESFSQVDPSTTRRYGGTGLGLAISRRLSELMGGTMWVESQTGRGSTFHFTVVAEAAPAPERPYERAGSVQLAGRRVLIVDDNATNRHILVKQAESWGMRAAESGTPAEALEWIRRGDPFDVAILDMQMPEMDGVTLAGEIRRYRDAEALPLVMLTSLGRGESPVEFAAYLMKPIKPSQLHDVLMHLFGAAVVSAEPPLPAGPDEHLADRLPLRILLVEDNAVNQQLAQLMLQKVGYRADVAANGVEALEALERQSYDAVLMDVEMPEMDGLEATRRIHQRWPREQRPHIIAVTANALPGERELCIQAGMDDYITKPIHIEELVGALGGAARRAGAPAQARALDPEVIRRLVDSLGEDGQGSVAALIDTFTSHAPEQIAAIRSALADGAADEVRREAHSLKSNATMFGAITLAHLGRELEALGKAGTLERGDDLLSRIELELQRVDGELGTIRQELER